MGSAFCPFSSVCFSVVPDRLRLASDGNIHECTFRRTLAERTRIARELHEHVFKLFKVASWLQMVLWKRPSDPVRMRQPWNSCPSGITRAIREGRAALNSCAPRPPSGTISLTLAQGHRECFVPESMSVTFAVLGDAREMHPSSVMRCIASDMNVRNACSTFFRHAIGDRAQISKELTLRRQ